MMSMYKVRIFPFFVCLVVILSACRRDELCYDHYLRAPIPISIDWSAARLSPNGATVVFYPLDGSTKQVELLSPEGGEVWLPEGKYAVVVFNETFEDFHAINFKDIENYSMIQACIKPSALLKGTNRYVSVYDHPDTLAVETLDMFEVTKEMVEYSHAIRSSHSQMELSSLRVPDFYKRQEKLSFQPVRLTAVTYVTLEVSGVENLDMASGGVSGFADGVYLASKTTSNSPVSHCCEFDFFSRKRLSGASLLHAAFTTFGKLDATPDDPYVLTSIFKLKGPRVDGTDTQTFVFDLTNNDTPGTMHTDHDGLQVVIYVNADGIKLDDVNPPPQEGGLSPGVGEWDEENVDIPVGKSQSRIMKYILK